MQKRTTPEYISNLPKNHIFVFGSNLSGRHGKGAAKTALRWGARYGRANGPQGRTYALPTKDAQIKHALSIDIIRPFVDEFIAFAKENVGLVFLVTEVGCGLSGLKPSAVAPLFIDAIGVENIHLPERFWNILNKI